MTIAAVICGIIKSEKMSIEWLARGNEVQRLLHAGDDAHLVFAKDATQRHADRDSPNDCLCCRDNCHWAARIVD